MWSGGAGDRGGCGGGGGGVGVGGGGNWGWCGGVRLLTYGVPF